VRLQVASREGGRRKERGGNKKKRGRREYIRFYQVCFLQYAFSMMPHLIYTKNIKKKRKSNQLSFIRK